jgi:SUMO ligase MMS21 Smc5/6 complex component
MPALAEAGDDDIVMGSAKISLKCPITTTWLENPVTR